MEGPTEGRERRTMTPAVLAAALFVAACATFAVTFVAARGGLQMPIAPTHPPIALASPGPSAAPTPAPTPEPLPSPAPTLEPTPIPTLPPPTVAPSVGPTPFALPTLRPNDPLLALDPCPRHPGCYLYVIQRFDTMNKIIGRYDLDLEVILVLNPQVTDPALIVVGHTLYLGRDRFVRLDPCPNGEACFLYVVVSGDSISAIADRYGITKEAILEANPNMPRPIVPDQVIKLPYPG